MSIKDFLFGKLTMDAFIHDPVAMGGVAIMGLVGLYVFGALFYYKKWKWLWHEWICSLDPKRIGVMYGVVVFLMLFKGIIDAVMMRLQQVWSVGSSQGYLSADHFQQIFTAHGSTMIFFVGMGIVFGSMNLMIPLQIGARDVAFPFLNSLGFWLFAFAALMLNVSLVIGEFCAAGWLAYPPLAGLEYSPGVGVDYWIWTLQIAGVGSLISGINFIVTIFKMRCPGMTIMKMPLFVWSSLCCLVLVIFAFPVLTATLGMLTLDRVIGAHFFTASFGGNPMMYVNFIWAWGHPEVYILVLPAFGIFSEVVATFSRKRLFGYVSMVWALVAITFLSFIVWLHHFFTMGAGPNVNAFFGVMTMIIAVPTGVKIFNWLITMYRGRIHFTSSMLWFLGYIFTFTIGGMTGVLMSVPAIDYQVHNSLFLVAHFHSMIIGAVVFGFISGVTYIFPKIMGFKLNEKLGKAAFWFWFIGFIAAFMPLYVLGFMGATRRLDHYDAGLGWHPLFIVAGVGAAFIFTGAIIQFIQVYVSIKERDQNLDTTGDPWNGRTLEWSTTSPPPIYNFAKIPEINDHDPFWEIKQRKEVEIKKPEYEDIHMPKDTPMGFIIASFAFLFAFGVIWWMHWLTVLGLVGIVVSLVYRLSDHDTHYYFSKEEVERIEAANPNRNYYV